MAEEFERKLRHDIFSFVMKPVSREIAGEAGKLLDEAKFDEQGDMTNAPELRIKLDALLKLANQGEVADFVVESMKEIRAKAAAAEEFKFPHFDVEARPKRVVKAKRRPAKLRHAKPAAKQEAPGYYIEGDVLARAPDPPKDEAAGQGRVLIDDARIAMMLGAHEARAAAARFPQGRIIRDAGDAVVPARLADALHAHAVFEREGAPNIFQALRMDRYGRVLPPDAKAPAPRPPPDEKSKTVSDVKTPSTSTAEVAPAHHEDAKRLQNERLPPLPADVAWEVHQFPAGRLGRLPEEAEVRRAAAAEQIEARRAAAAIGIPARMDFQPLRRAEMVAAGLQFMRAHGLEPAAEVAAPVAGLPFDERFDMPRGRGHWGMEPAPAYERVYADGPLQVREGAPAYERPVRGGAEPINIVV